MPTNEPDHYPVEVWSWQYCPSNYVPGGGTANRWFSWVPYEPGGMMHRWVRCRLATKMLTTYDNIPDFYTLKGTPIKKPTLKTVPKADDCPEGYKRRYTLSAADIALVKSQSNGFPQGYKDNQHTPTAGDPHNGSKTNHCILSSVRYFERARHLQNVWFQNYSD